MLGGVGRKLHVLSDIDEASRTATCAECGPVTIRRMGRQLGHGWRCNRGNPPGKNRRRRFRSHKGTVCERCGFVPEDPCQLDVHHRDGDHANEDPENFGTLCANCHRLVTRCERDGRPVPRFRRKRVKRS